MVKATEPTTTIQISLKTRDGLNKRKVHPNQSYDEVIQKLLEKEEA